MVSGYDLDKPGQNYEKVWDEIKSLSSAYWHKLDSTWLVVTSLTATLVRDRVWAVMDVVQNRGPDGRAAGSSWMSRMRSAGGTKAGTRST